MEKSPRDMTIDEARAHYGLPAHWEVPEVAAWVMARLEPPPPTMLPPDYVDPYAAGNATVEMRPMMFCETERRTVEWSEIADGSWTLTEEVETALSNFLGRDVRL